MFFNKGASLNCSIRTPAMLLSSVIITGMVTFKGCQQKSGKLRSTGMNHSLKRNALNVKKFLQNA